MAALPAAYRIERVEEGRINPDFEAFGNALAPPTPSGEETKILPLRELGDRIMQTSEAFPRIGRQGTFGYMYGNLTYLLADQVDGKPNVSFLPRIECPDDLIVQANYFERSWQDPSWYYCKYLEAVRNDDVAQSLYAKLIGEHWWYSFDTPKLQLAEPAVQFFSGGMAGHILGDLAKDLVRSGVSQAYMRRDGTYDAVNESIRYITWLKAPEVIQGSERMVNAAVDPIANSIACTRWIARRAFMKMKVAEEAGDDRQVISIQESAIRMALHASQVATSVGNVAMKVLQLVTGGDSVPPRDTGIPPKAAA